MPITCNRYIDQVRVWTCVCFRIKPSFPPVDIQHNQCPRRCFNPRENQALCVRSSLNNSFYPSTSSTTSENADC